MTINTELLLDRLPEIKLSYDKILHKKVYANLYMLIPDGNKTLAWFTYYKNMNICVLIHLDKRNNINKVEEITLSFHKSLSYGTIIVGTCFNYNNRKYFSCEDILYYKNQNLINEEYLKRLTTMKDIFQNELRQVIYTKSFVVFGLPIMTNNINQLLNIMPNVSYNTKGILFINYDSIQKVGILLNNVDYTRNCIFKVKADIKSDIYSLYCKDNVFYNYACIPDYKTSVMMNKLFRHIKENSNLDLLEESDNEEEFENIAIDKYVDLNKEYYIKCEYINRFKKWKPITCVEKIGPLLTKQQIIELEK